MNKIEDKIEEVLGYDRYEPSSFARYLLDTGQYEYLVKDLSTLIAQERKDAIEGFFKWHNKHTDIYTIYKSEVEEYLKTTHNSEEGEENV